MQASMHLQFVLAMFAASENAVCIAVCQMRTSVNYCILPCKLRLSTGATVE